MDKHVVTRGGLLIVGDHVVLSEFGAVDAQDGLRVTGISEEDMDALCKNFAKHLLYKSRIVDSAGMYAIETNSGGAYYCVSKAGALSEDVKIKAPYRRKNSVEMEERFRSAIKSFVAQRYNSEVSPPRWDRKEPKSSSSDNEVDDRLALLANAARNGESFNDPLQELDALVWADTINVLGGETILGRSILSREDLVEALSIGLPADVLGKLREAGYSYAVLDQVVAPRRTLMRRKATQQRLTQIESDGAWRLAHILSLASRVLDGREAALEWLSREKVSLRGRTPLELTQTSVGTAHVESILQSLDWGDVA